MFTTWQVIFSWCSLVALSLVLHARLQTYLDVLKKAVLLLSVIACWRNFLIKTWQDQDDCLCSCQWLIYKEFLERSLYEWKFFVIQPKGEHASHGHVLRIWEGISHDRARVFIWSAREIWHNRSHFKINPFSQPEGTKRDPEEKFDIILLSDKSDD